MSTTKDTPSDTTEHCTECDRSTAHTVRVELVTESENDENAGYSREPYRISECIVCGTSTSLRMNNA